MTRREADRLISETQEEEEEEEEWPGNFEGERERRGVETER